MKYPFNCFTMTDPYELGNSLESNSPLSPPTPRSPNELNDENVQGMTHRIGGISNTYSAPLTTHNGPPRDETLGNRIRSNMGVGVPQIPMPSFSFLNNFAATIGNLPTRIVAQTTYFSENAFANFWTSILGKQRMVPSLPNLWFLLKMSLIQQREEETVDPLDSAGEMNSVQYYSQDEISNLKIKVTIQKVDEQFGGFGGENRTKEAELKEVQLLIKEQWKGTQRERALKYLKEKLNQIKNMTNNRKNSEFKKHVSIINWQEKILGPRELTRFRMANPQDLQTPLDEIYKKKADLINTLIQNDDLMNDDIFPYIQDAEKRKILKQQRKEERIESDSESNSNSDSDSQSESRRTRKRKQDRINITFKEVLQYPIFTYTNSDAFECDDLLYPISCSTKSFPKRYRKPKTRSQLDDTVQTMYIMSGIGAVEDLQDGFHKWKGDEYVICIIRAYKDGTFDMKPGLSAMPQEFSSSEIQNKYRKERLEKEHRIHILDEKCFLFRARNGGIYRYTIHLFNDQKRDTTVDKMRKAVLDEMYNRTVGMRQNLVGKKFTEYPRHPEHTRFHIAGNILSGHNFESGQYCIRYFLDIPTGYVIENRKTILLSATTQYSIPEDKNGSEFAYFGLPFEIHVLATKENLQPIRMYFEVKSRDYFGRIRVEGYGFITFPMIPSRDDYEIGTWKPRESIRRSIASWFIGGSSELEDVKYSGIPTGFTDKFLNKYGVPTVSSGSIKMHLEVIAQKKPPQKRKVQIRKEVKNVE